MTGQNHMSLRLAVSTEQPRPTVMQALWNSILSVVYICGVLLCTVTVTGARCNIVFLLGITVVITIASSLLYSFEKTAVFGVAVPFAVIAGCFVTMPKLTADGFLTAYNGLLDSIGVAFGRIMPKIDADGGSGISFWIVFASVFIILTIFSINNRRALLLSLITLTTVLLCGTTNRISIWGLLFLVLASVGIILNRLGKVPNLKPAVLISRIIAIGCLIAVLSTAAGSLPGSLFNSANTYFKRTSDSLRYGGESILPEGDFSCLQDFLPSDKTQLEVVMSKPDSYYLRGYIGERYTAKGWTSLDKSKLYENSDLFYWLHKNKFYGQTQITALQNLLEQNAERNIIHVKNINASAKYIYAPYEVISADSDLILDNHIGDSALSSNGVWGTKNYSYTASQNLIKRYTSIVSELNNQEGNETDSVTGYLSNEAHYNEFVYENYLEIPENVRDLLEQCFGKHDLGKKHWDYTKAKQSILNYLTSNCVYSEKASAVKNDFVTEFLTENTKGYSVHFATTAALMFRYYGIPARYVEGYIISPDDIENTNPNTAIEVKQTQAHAWAEFYQDGVGWIPFEATPNYLGIMEQAEDLTGVISDVQDSLDDDQDDKNDEAVNEKQGVDEMSEQGENLVLKTAIIIAAVLIGAGLIVFLCLLLHSMKKKRKLYKTFDGSDLKLAVINMFAYSVDLLVKNKRVVSPQNIYDYDFGLKNIFDEDYKQSFSAAFKIYQKAYFSEHEICEAEKNKMSGFMSATRQLCKKKRGERR